MGFLGRFLACTGAAGVCALAACGGGNAGGGGTTPPVSSVAVAPSAPTLAIGLTQQFTATVSGSSVTDHSVSWSVSAAAGSALSPGTVDATGLYTTPYPAPATVTVTATSNQDKAVSGSTTVKLNRPATAKGPSMTVDVNAQMHPINPLIYGMNAFQLASSTGSAARITVDRFGGDGTSRYNYELDVTGWGSDWYFENGFLSGGTGQKDTGAFNQQVAADQKIGAKTLATVPVNGWVAKNSTSCSFPVST